MRVFDDDGVCSRSEEPGVFAFSFSRLRRTTAKPVRGMAPFVRTTRLERTRGERDETKTREDRAFASAGVGRHRAAFAATRGSSGARSALPRSTRELVPRRSVANDTHRSRRTRRTTVARREWASHRTGRTSGTARGLASTARTSEAVRTEGRVHEERRAEHFAPTNRARASQGLGGARGSAETSAPRHTHLSSDSVRASGNDRERTPRNVEPYIVWANSVNRAVLVFSFSREPAVGASRGKKSACTSASHQGTRSAARGFRPAAPGSAPFVRTRVPFASPAGRVSSAPRASGASVKRRRPNAHRAHRRRRRPDAARRR